MEETLLSPPLRGGAGGGWTTTEAISYPLDSIKIATRHAPGKLCAVVNSQ